VKYERRSLDHRIDRDEETVGPFPAVGRGEIEPGDGDDAAEFPQLLFPIGHQAFGFATVAAGGRAFLPPVEPGDVGGGGSGHCYLRAIRCEGQPYPRAPSAASRRWASIAVACAVAAGVRRKSNSAVQWGAAIPS